MSVGSTESARRSEENLLQRLGDTEQLWRRRIVLRDEANHEIRQALEQLIELSGQRIMAEKRLPCHGWQLKDARALWQPEYPWQADAVLAAANYYSARIPLPCTATGVVAILHMESHGLGLLFMTTAELLQFCAHQQLRINVTAFRTETAS